VSTANAGTKASRAYAHLVQRMQGMHPHQMLPRELDLAAELGISRTTLRQVLMTLASAGSIYSVRGSGTFVSGAKIDKGTSLSGFSEDMRARGMTPGSRLLHAGPELADGEVAEHLSLRAGAVVYRIERLRLANEIPMCIEEVRFPAEFFPDLLTHDVSAGLYDLLKSEYGVEVAVARQSISSSVATAVEAELLGIAVGDPVMNVQRTSQDARGRSIEWGRSRYRGDRYEFTLTATRNGHV
jgi:GntR family transcriptional regulator